MTRTTRVRVGLFGAAGLAALTGLHPATLRAEPASPQNDTPVFSAYSSLVLADAVADAEGEESPVADAQEPEGEAPASAAKPGAPKRGIEEITVTARRRDELLQNTPLAITAFSESDLEARSVQSITEIAQSTPNLQFDSTAGSNSNARIFIRGVGQDDPIFTADPGVGLYIDGVSFTRSGGSIFDLVDVERVEVLRGPQGALYGKSTIGGAINVITRKPDGDFEGSVRGAIGEDQRRDLRTGVGFPIVPERVFGRLSLATTNSDGYASDAATGGKLNDRESSAARGSLRFLPTDSLEFTITGDRVYQRQESIAFKLRQVDSANGLVRVGNLLGDDFGAGLRISDPFLVSTDTPSRNDLDTYGLSLNAEWSPGDTFFGNDVKIQAITAWRKVEQKVNFDVDGTASGGVNNFIQDNQRQFSQEIRLLGSALDNKLDFGVGGFYFREDGQGMQRTELFASGSQAVRDTRAAVRCLSPDGFDFEARSDVFQNPNSTLEQQDAVVMEVADRVFVDLAPIFVNGASVIRNNPNCGAVVNPDNVALLIRGGNGGGGMTGTVEDPRRAIATALLAVPDDNTVSTNNQILNTNYAAYAYAAYDLTDKISLELAGRYNYEIKDLFRNQLLVPSGAAVIDNASVEENFRDFSPQASISWQISDETLTFFRYARGFKSGGFNGRAQRIRAGGVSSQEAKGLLKSFDPETIQSLEFGYKTSFFDRRLAINTSFFYNFYDDIQQQRLGRDETGQLTSIIDNAAKAIIQGFELEATALLPTNTTLNLGTSITGARFTEFPGGVPNPDFDENDPNSVRAFDGTDLHLANTPLFTLTAGISQEIELPWGTLTPRIDYFMRSRSFNNVRNTDATRTNKFGVFSARLSYAPNEGKWGVALVCRNVFDREYLVNGVDLLDAFGFASGQFGPPRDFYIEASYRF